MKIFLVRHAHADWTPDENRPLSAQGLRDAKILADTLAANPIEMVISSPYLRAIQTVQPLASRLGLEVSKDDRFRERALGCFSDVSFTEAVRRTWMDFSFSYPDGESNSAAQVRAVQALQALTKHEAEHVAVGTHGNIMALILNYYDPTVGFDFWSKLSMPDYRELVIDL